MDNLKNSQIDSLKLKQQLLIKKKKQARKRRFIRFIIFLILFLVFLVIGFNFITNPSFFSEIVQTFKSFYLEPATKNYSNLEVAKNAGIKNTGVINIHDENQEDFSGDKNTDLLDGTSNSFTGYEGQQKNSQSQNQELQSSNLQTAKENKTPRILLFFQNILNLLKINIEKEEKNFPSKLEIKVYFAALGNEAKFVYEKRTIIAQEPKIAVQNAVEELLKGPIKPFNYPVIPPGTKLNKVEIYKNFAEIDFSEEFVKNNIETPILDEYVIYTIVNTVTQIPEVDGVIFSINGKRIKYYGNVDLSIPAIKNDKYLEEEKE